MLTIGTMYIFCFSPGILDELKNVFKNLDSTFQWKELITQWVKGCLEQNERFGEAIIESLVSKPIGGAVGNLSDFASPYADPRNTTIKCL